MTALAIGLVAVGTASADTVYVWTNSATDGPGTAWSNAFHTIQGAVDAATNAGDVVLVTNGVYDTGGKPAPGASLTNRVCITSAISVRSVNGASNTFILGMEGKDIVWKRDAVRGVFMATGVLSGFSITNGHTMDGGGDGLSNVGGGIRMIGGAVVSNCSLTGNSAYSGGGAWCSTNSLLRGCSVSGNSAYMVGCGVALVSGTMQNCTVSRNHGDSGGGVFCYLGGTVMNCVVSGNTAEYGGGVYCYEGGVLINCEIVGNLADSSFLDRGGGAYVYLGGALVNCTLVGNTADSASGVYLDGGGGLTNCVVFGNTPGGVSNTMGAVSGTVRYTCSPGLSGDGNITNDPQFLDAAAGNYRLGYGSPCIDAATVSDGVSGDLDGNSRPVDGDFDGTNDFDMGAYEYTPAVYDTDGDGLTDGDELDMYGTSPTNTNTDGDLHTDYEEMIADTDGANPNEYFCITAISNSSPVTVYFEASSNRYYTMRYCSNLVHGAWTNVPGAGPRRGQQGADSMSDMNEPLKGPFYQMQVGLQGGQIKVRRDLQAIAAAIEQLRLDTGRWPNGVLGDDPGHAEVLDLTTDSAGLLGATPIYEGWQGPYLSYIDPDPWGMPYFFDPDYITNGVWCIAIGSFGPNRVGRNLYDADDIIQVLD